jgi:hypothetical protein
MESHVTAQEHERHGLGWIPEEDERDNAFPMLTALDRIGVPQIQQLPKSKMWTLSDIRIDQGASPRCAGYSGQNWELTEPVMDPYEKSITGDDLYTACKQVDGYPDQDGTTTNALMKVLRDRGLVKTWTWAWLPSTVKRFVLGKGPVLVGSWWRAGMDNYSADFTMSYTGENRGGHAYLLVGYDDARKAFRVLNSWGDHWADNGCAWLTYGSLWRMILEKGKFCGALEEQVLF